MAEAKKQSQEQQQLDIEDAQLNAPVTVRDMVKALAVAEKEFEKRFAFKEHDHIRYAKTSDVQLQLNALVNPVPLAYYLIVIGLALVGLIAIFIGISLWFAPVAWIVGGSIILLLAVGLGLVLMIREGKDEEGDKKE